MSFRFAKGPKQALIRCLVLVAAIIAIACSYDYAIQAGKRVHESPGCHWNLVPGTLATPYVARFCYLTRDMVLLQIRDSKERQLLAERTYMNLGLAKFHWTPSELNYDTSTGDSISIPPSLLDRLRTKLP